MRRLLPFLLLFSGCAFLKDIPIHFPPPEPQKDDCRLASMACAEGFICVGKNDPARVPPDFFQCEAKPVEPPAPPEDPCQNVKCKKDFHCEKGSCVADAPVTPPEPPADPFKDYVLPGEAFREITTHPQGQGFDSTPTVKNSLDYCKKIGYGEFNGQPRASCPLGPDFTELRYAKEREFLGQRCPSWYFSADGTNWQRCTSAPHPVASCDHFDLKEVPPAGCDENTGFFTIIHGAAWFKACAKDEKSCSEKFWVNY